MEGIAAAPGDEVNLHRGLAETLVQIELVGLHGHLPDIFQTSGHDRCGVPGELHAAGAADHAVDIVALVD